MMVIIFAVGSFLCYKGAEKTYRKDDSLTVGLLMASGFLAICAIALVGHYIFYA